jgi:inner membrane transporter RhtA
LPSPAPIAAGVLASAVPYLADLIALRRVPAPVFGVLTNVNPIFAAAIGALALQQSLGPSSGAASS